MAERLTHVLVKLQVLRFEYGAVLGAQVRLEAVQGHGTLLLGCTGFNTNQHHVLLILKHLS